MRVQYPNLALTLKEQNVTYAQLTSILGVSKSTLRRRLIGVSDWKIHEVVLICQFLERWDSAQLFLRLDTKS